MQNKKQFSHLLLGIALVLSLLRSDDGNFPSGNSRHLFRLPELQDILLGQTAVLTQTEFHNLFNSEDGDYVHPKGLQRDSRFIHSLINTIDPERWMDMSPYRQVTTLLLDRLESSNGRQLYFNHANNNNHGEDENGNQQGNEDEIGAMAIPPSPTDELTQEDMDVIERLWRQDIDMGICRDDSLSTKEGYELEKPIKKPEENIWDNFSIDNETGEFMQPVIDPASQLNTQQITTTIPIPQQTQLQFSGQNQENGMTLEECLQILEEDFNPLQNTRQEPEPAMHSPQEMEQRWQDFASLSDINLNLPPITPEVSPEYSPEYHQQAVMPENFTMGSPINFGMNLPNTTENLNMLHYPSSHHHAATNRPTSMHSSEDVFTPTPTLSDLSVNTTSLPSASLHIPNGMNFTNLLMSETNRSISDEYSGRNDSSTSSLSSRNGTSPLLLDLLNSSTLDEVDTMDIDGIRDVMDVVLDDRDSAISLGSVSQFTDPSDSSSLYSGSEDGSSEGAVGGYDGSLDQDVKGASGYSRGNAQYGGDRQGGGQANRNNQQSNLNSINHNHTYSDMSSRNGSVNGNTRKKNQQQKNNNEMGSRYSRDEKRAKMLKIPIPVQKIIDLPVDQFNELLKNFEMNDPQLALVRDIRRRGKNKVAAQNCRKRKIDAIYTIEEEIDMLKVEKEDLLEERGNIDKESLDMRERYTQLYREVFQSLRDDHGDPVNPNNFSLQQMPDGSVYLVPRNSTVPDDDEKDK